MERGGTSSGLPELFYQPAEGAALLALLFCSQRPGTQLAVDWDSVPAEVWARTQLVFVCSPGTTHKAVMPLPEWESCLPCAWTGYGFDDVSSAQRDHFQHEPP